MWYFHIKSVINDPWQICQLFFNLEVKHAFKLESLDVSIFSLSYFWLIREYVCYNPNELLVVQIMFVGLALKIPHVVLI